MKIEIETVKCKNFRYSMSYNENARKCPSIIIFYLASEKIFTFSLTEEGNSSLLKS